MDGAEALVRFVEASVGRDAMALADARDVVTAQLGAEVLVDAAGVASAFQMMNRLANATGTPLDTDLVDMTAGVRADLELDRYGSAPGATGGVRP